MLHEDERPYRVERPDPLRALVLPLPVAPRRRRWRLALALLSAAVAVIGVRVVDTTVTRLRTYTAELRRLRANLVARRQQVAQQREELVALGGEIDRLASVTAMLRDRAALVRRDARFDQSREPKPLPLDPPPIAGGQAVWSEEGIRAWVQLAALAENVGQAAQDVGILAVVLHDAPGISTVAPRAVLWPVRGEVSSEFGGRSSPSGGGFEQHPGIDIKGEYGDPVRAAAEGVVVYAERMSGYGIVVVVGHGGGVKTLYGHLSAAYVHDGQRVRAGDVVGAMGATGNATGVHCHFEVRVDGRPVDPRHYLSTEPAFVQAAQPPSRLIPVGAKAIDTARRADLRGILGP